MYAIIVYVSTRREDGSGDPFPPSVVDVLVQLAVMRYFAEFPESAVHVVNKDGEPLVFDRHVHLEA